MTDLREKARVLLFDLRRPVEAEKAIREALTQSPDDTRLLAWLSQSLRMQNRYREAFEAGRQAVELDPENPDAFCALGQIQADRGRHDKADGLFREALRLAPHEPFLHMLLGWNYYASREYREALQAALNGLRLDPQFVGCLTLAAAANSELGNKTTAIEHLERARALEPENSEVRFYLGQVNLYRFRWWGALREYREALRLEPTCEASRFNILRTLDRLLLLLIPVFALAIIVLFGAWITWELNGGAPKRLFQVLLAGWCFMAGFTLLTQTGRNFWHSLYPLGRSLLTPREKWDARIAVIILVVALLIMLVYPYGPARKLP